MTDTLPSKPYYRVRMWALFASGADKAVILRRGPRTHYQLIDWDLRRDVFKPGQWMRGHVWLCDLSPSGDRLLYWAHQYAPSAHWRRALAELQRRATRESPYDPQTTETRNRSPKRRQTRRKVPRYMRETGKPPAEPRWGSAVRRNEGVWTAISRPPFFSALAIWPSFGHWTGGGMFLSENEIVLQDDNVTPKQNVPVPASFAIHSSFAPEFRNKALTPNAWRMCKLDPVLRDSIAVALKKAGAAWIEWMAPRKNGDLLFACDGRIYRLAKWQDVTPEEYLAGAKDLADFRWARFEKVAPPDRAMQW